MGEKKFKKIFLVSLAAAAVSAIASFWLFQFDWPFLPFPLLAGLFMALTQNENSSYKFLDKLLAGSLFFGFSTLWLSYSLTYFISNIIYSASWPFWPFYNPWEYLIGSLVFSFISLLGGLIGIVIKGCYYLKSKHAR